MLTNSERKELGAFVNKLRRYNLGWRKEGGAIRTCSGGYCPLVAIARQVNPGRTFSNSDFVAAARSIGSSPLASIARDIANAADTEKPSPSALLLGRTDKAIKAQSKALWLRRQLESACGL